MAKTPRDCPFSIGEKVIYTPSTRGSGLAAMTDDLVPGGTYQVSSIDAGAYVSVKGHVGSGGGLFWTEFSPIEDVR